MTGRVTSWPTSSRLSPTAAPFSATSVAAWEHGSSSLSEDNDLPELEAAKKRAFQLLEGPLRTSGQQDVRLIVAGLARSPLLPPPACLDGLLRSLSALSSQRCLLAGPLLQLRPVRHRMVIPHPLHNLSGYELQVVHPVAGGTKHHEVLEIVVLPIPVDMSDIQDRRDGKAAVGAHGLVVSKSEFPTIHTLSRVTAVSSRLYPRNELGAEGVARKAGVSYMNSR